MSLCNQVLDFSDDVSKELFKSILQKELPPALAKTAHVVTPETKQRLGRDAFALVIMTKEGAELRKFPIQDAANTWLSCRYFEKTAYKLPVRAKEMAASHLSNACDKFGLPDTVPGFRQGGGNVYHEAYDVTKTASTIEVESLIPDKSEHFYACQGRYAMPSGEFVKKAADYFEEHEKQFTPAARHEYAHNVLERAKELQVKIAQADLLRKYAGAGYGDIIDVQLRMRHDLLDGSPYQETLTKVAVHKSDMTPLNFAQLLHTFDKKASLNKYYDSSLADPYKAVFEKRFTKTASGYNYDSEDGSSVSETDLTKTFHDKYSKVKGYFGPSVADSLKKHGCQIFDSLPRDAKEVIVKISKGHI